MLASYVLNFSLCCDAHKLLCGLPIEWPVMESDRKMVTEYMGLGKPPSHDFHLKYLKLIKGIKTLINYTHR